MLPVPEHPRPRLRPACFVRLVNVRHIGNADASVRFWLVVPCYVRQLASSDTPDSYQAEKALGVGVDVGILRDRPLAPEV